MKTLMVVLVAVLGFVGCVAAPATPVDQGAAAVSTVTPATCETVTSVDVAPVNDPSFDAECQPVGHADGSGAFASTCTLDAGGVMTCPVGDGTQWLWYPGDVQEHELVALNVTGHHDLLCSVLRGFVTHRRSTGSWL